MPVERPAGRPGRGNSLLMSALRLAGYDLDNNRPTTPPTRTTSTSSITGGAPASAASSPSSISEIDPPTPQAGAVSAGGRYMHALPADVEPTRVLLQEYSGIPADEVDRHVYRMRDRLWDVYPYACVGRFRFASLEFASDAYYQLALFRLLQAQADSDSNGGDKGEMTMLLDVGCCVGQVLRKLAFDGVEPSRLFGTDVEPRFLDIGYDLFRDRDRFEGRFVIGDLLRPGRRRSRVAAQGERGGERREGRHGNNGGNNDENDGDDGDNGKGQEEEEEEEDRLALFDSKMTFIHATSFFHLFTWDEQVRAATRMVRFLRPDSPDVMLFGRQVGTMLPPRDGGGRAGSDKVYLHNSDSWQRLWDEVGTRTGTRWRAVMEPTERIETGVESSLRKMTFCVVRG